MLTKLLRLCLPVFLFSVLLTGCFSSNANYGSSLGNTNSTNTVPPIASVTPSGSSQPPQRVALLLPLEGDLSTAAKIVQQGFYAAYAPVSNKPSIKVYDTGQGQPIATVYANAVSDGANIIIGPLEKSNVATLQTQGNLPVATIALNQLDDSSTTVTPNLYQFALSPIDEAKQVADKAALDGYHNALLITPAGAWGNSIATALQQRWQQAGGTIVGSLSTSANPNLTNQIKQLLQVDGSTRRQDVDVIFMIAQPLLARQIMPLLKFYYAGDIPVYSDSLVYTGIPDSAADQDLNNVEFCDIPLVISPQNQWVQVRQQIISTWPTNQQQYIRLYAFGADAAMLSMRFNQLSTSPVDGLPGATGALYKDDQQHILRQLTWARFQGGLANSL